MPRNPDGSRRYTVNQKEAEWIDEVMSGRGDKPRLARWAVRMKPNQPRYNAKYLLALGFYRILMIKKKFTGGKTIAKEYHYLDVLGITCTSDSLVTLVFRSGDAFMFETPWALELVLMLQQSQDRICASFPPSALPKLTLSDAFMERMRTQQQVSEPFFSGEQAAGCLVPTYCAHAYHMGKYPSNTIVQYIKKQSDANLTFLDLTEILCLHPAGSKARLIPLMRALRYNTYFHSLQIRDFQRRDTLRLYAIALEHNSTIFDVQMTGVDEPVGMEDLLKSITLNPMAAISSIDFSYSAITRVRGSALALADAIAALPHGLISLRLACCNIPAKGICSIVGALLSNRSRDVMHTLNLAGNDLSPGRDSTRLIRGLLSTFERLQVLVLRKTGVDVVAAVLALTDGSTSCIEALDIGDNRVTSFDLPAVLRNFIVRCQRLSWLCLAGMSLSADVFESVVKSIDDNERLRERQVMLDVSFNKFGSSKSSAVKVAAAMGASRTLNGIDLSQTALKLKHVVPMMDRISLTGVRRLTLGTVKHSSASALVDSLVRGGIGTLPAISMLQHLTIRGDARYQFKEALIPMLAALGSNDSLIHLDISNNLVGEKGMLTLTRSLQTNKTLIALICDDNGANLDVWQELRLTLRTENNVLCHVDFPQIDLRAGSAKNVERVREVWSDISDALWSNFNRIQFTPAYQQLVRFECSDDGSGDAFYCGDGSDSEAAEGPAPEVIPASDSSGSSAWGEPSAAQTTEDDPPPVVLRKRRRSARARSRRSIFDSRRGSCILGESDGRGSVNALFAAMGSPGAQPLLSPRASLPSLEDGGGGVPSSATAGGAHEVGLCAQDLHLRMQADCFQGAELMGCALWAGEEGDDENEEEENSEHQNVSTGSRSSSHSTHSAHSAVLFEPPVQDEFEFFEEAEEEEEGDSRAEDSVNAAHEEELQRMLEFEQFLRKKAEVEEYERRFADLTASESRTRVQDGSAGRSATASVSPAESFAPSSLAHSGPLHSRDSSADLPSHRRKQRAADKFPSVRRMRIRANSCEVLGATVATGHEDSGRRGLGGPRIAQPATALQHAQSQTPPSSRRATMAPDFPPPSPPSHAAGGSPIASQPSSTTSSRSPTEVALRVSAAQRSMNRRSVPKRWSAQFEGR